MAENSLSEEQIEQKIDELGIWGVVGDKLATRIEFDNYKEAVFFANTVYSVAEKQYHHPKVTVEWGAVNIDINTHEEESLTQKDFDLAEEIEKNLGEMDWS